jgi:DNA polymerase
LIPGTGCDFVISDFGAIENRVLGWLCDEQTVLDVFRNKLDPYKDMASVIFGIPYEQVTKNQRQAGKVGVLGCGYGMGHEKLTDFAAAIGVDLTKSGVTPEQVIEAYRSRFPKIAGYPDGEYEGRTIRRGGIWRDYETAFRAAIDGQTSVVGKCRFFPQGNNVLIQLPSGRCLCYRQCRVEERMTRFGPRMVPLYQSARGEVQTYGGKLTENIDQAVSRDLLVEAMVPFWDEVVLHVHDEIVLEVPKSQRDAKLEKLVRTMTIAPSWAEGLPLAADGHSAPRYTKSAWPGYPKFGV